jgi:hypothetical protein
MNNKRSVYILLPLVALVWGLIGWRIWAAASEPEEATALAAATAPKVQPAAARLPRLRRGYADPFRPVAGGRPPGSSGPVPAVAYAPAAAPILPAAPATRLAFPVRPEVPAPPPTATINWPDIKYLGIITHANGQAQVALLNINNEESIVKVGHSTHDIQVLRLFRDSVQVSFKNQKRSFHRLSPD